MPTDAVWIVITIPKKEHEVKKLKDEVSPKPTTLSADVLNNATVRKPAIRYPDENNFLNASNKAKNVNLGSGSNNNLSTNNLSKNTNQTTSFDLTPATDRNRNQESLESILEDALAQLEIHDVVWFSSKNGKSYHVYFPLDLYDNDATLNYLQGRGIGCRKDSSIGYIPFGLYFINEGNSDEENSKEEEEEDDVFYTGGQEVSGNKKTEPTDSSGSKKSNLHGFKKLQEDFLKSVTSRMTVAQVVTGVRSSAELTFDFVMYTIFAGCIAAAGLLNNSAVDVAAAMMIEPVMATVMAITFGLVIHDNELTYIGVRSCIISLIICLAVGYVYGAFLFIWMDQWNPPPDGFWPTGEMSVRGEWRTLIYGFLQASAAGGAIAVTLLNDNQAALVGVAVASTFLPPFINTGLLWAYATHITIRGHGQSLKKHEFNNHTYFLKDAWLPNPGYEPKHYYDQRWEFMALSGVSMIYTLVNIICMLVMAYLFLRVKEVVPLGSLEPNKRFFMKDIKVARDYNRRMTMANIHGVTTSNSEAMGDQILSEWAEITGLDASTLLSDKPEARVTRRQTLHDIIADVHQDNIYQSVTRQAVGLKNTGSETFLRRLTNGSIYRRKSSINPVSSQAVFDVESAAGRTTPTRAGRFFVNKMRRGSRWTKSPADSVTNSITSLNTTGVDTIPMRRPLSSTSSANRGLRPEELDKGRRSSVLLQKSLRGSDHSPFSLWPASRSPLDSTSSQKDALKGTEKEGRRRKSAVSFSRRASSRPPSSSAATNNIAFNSNTVNMAPSSSPITRSPRTNSSMRKHRGAINESFESE